MDKYRGPIIKNLSYPTTFKDNVSVGSSEILPILGIDPGGTTGWSFIAIRSKLLWRKESLENVIDSKFFWNHGQIDCRGKGQEDEGVYQLRKLIDEWPSAAIVIEDFILRPARKESSRELLSPVRITAKLEHHLWMRKRLMHLQSPSLAKRLSDERLKYFNVYTSKGGMQHARDADRHVLMFIRRCLDTKGHELQQLSWPNAIR